jgi:hypothetical protein
MDSAARGHLSRAELEWLASAAHHPAWAEFRRFARASNADMLGARYAVPFGREASILDLPLVRIAHVKGLAYANPSRVAWYLSRGQRDSAEIALKEGISFGFQLVDAGNTLIDELVGIVIVGIARRELVQFYEATGNPAGARFKAATDSVIASVVQSDTTATVATPAPLNRFDPMSVRQATIRTALERRYPRGVRTEMLFALGFMPCTNAQELVFGPAADVRSLFAWARSNLVRFPSDSALIELAYNRAERPPHQEPSGVFARLAIAAADVAGFVLHNRRIPGCVRTLWAT